jgi:hypothetical protein
MKKTGSKKSRDTVPLNKRANLIACGFEVSKTSQKNQYAAHRLKSVPQLVEERFRPQ